MLGSGPCAVGRLCRQPLARPKRSRVSVGQPTIYNIRCALCGADPAPYGPHAGQEDATGQHNAFASQFDAITRLPRAEQKIVSRFLDTMIAQHGVQTGQEATPAS